MEKCDPRLAFRSGKSRARLAVLERRAGHYAVFRIANGTRFESIPGHDQVQTFQRSRNSA